MTEIAIMVCVALMLWALVREARLRPSYQLALSPFWYFTLLFIVSFPMRAYLIHHQLIDLQTMPIDQGYHFSETVLSSAVLISMFMWLAVMWGRQCTLGTPIPANFGLTNHAATPSFLRISTGLALIACLAIIGMLTLSHKTMGDFNGATYQAARMGSGQLWLLPELIMYGTVGLVGWIIARRDKHLTLRIYLLLAVVVALTFWASGVLFTRRLLAGALLALVILLVVRNNRMWGMATLAILATVFASRLLDLVRHFYVLMSEGHPIDDVISKLIQFIAPPFLVIHSSFEGVEHLMVLFEKTTWIELLTGVDQGVSWLFNFGLGLIPRAIWASKPVVYGGMEQFHWLYPQIFKGDFAAAAIPMSFAVDFSFGFGLPFALIMAYVFGRLLGAVERSFWDRASHPALVALCLFIFIYMFNWVRGGTIIVQSVILFSLPAALMFGLRPVVHAALGLAGEAVGLVGGTWWGTTRVYFYPHKYLRDRQLDTVRNWPTGNAVNAEIAMDRTGAQVGHDQATVPSRPSWKSALPLVNLKRRPKDAPDDAAVYVWGGLVAKGPFITDIDNPYAFTGYNTLAVRLYRPVIRAFLESPRCLQIRCLSQACLDGVRREYGEHAAAKALVVYPAITPAVDSPPPQLAQRCRFLFVSTQFEIKGGESLLKAFARVVKTFPGAELDLVTHLPEQFTTLANETLNVRVHSANFTRDQIAMRFLNNADVLVHPTYFDSFGMIVLEALAHGLPIIATDVYAIGEMVEHNKNGLLLEAPISIWSGRSPTALFSNTTKMRAAARSINNQAFEATLADAMIKFACDAELRTRAGRASLELVRTRFAGKA